MSDNLYFVQLFSSQIDFALCNTFIYVVHIIIHVVVFFLILKPQSANLLC